MLKESSNTGQKCQSARKKEAGMRVQLKIGKEKKLKPR
jgi:hypothetical protein